MTMAETSRHAADEDARTTAGPEAEAETEAETETPGTTAEAEAADPALRIAELEAERDELKKRVMYALADVENIRKRSERDRRDAELFGGTKLARDLLSVHDNLERALDNADEDARAHAGPVLEGIELTHRELLNAFSRHRIEKVRPEKGATFDPNLHQAMFEVPVPGAPSGTVVEVMQAGFTIAGRLLRPALVGVARHVDAGPDSGEADTETP